MSDSSEIKVPVWFWLASLLALVWYLFGVFQFYSSLTMSPESLAPMVEAGQMTQSYADFIVVMPLWIKALFGVATLGGALGSLLLLMRKRSAKILFILSLCGAVLMYISLYGFSGKLYMIPASDLIIAGVVMVVTSLMILFAGRMKMRGILS